MSSEVLRTIGIEKHYIQPFVICCLPTRLFSTEV